jgi:hypothetical protein
MFAVPGKKTCAYSCPSSLLLQHEPQPLSQAVSQLEQAVTDGRLPQDALAANQAALSTLKSFLEGLTNPRSYPKAGIQNVQFSVWYVKRASGFCSTG